MLATIPSPMPDQTLESIAALAWLQNPWPTWREAAKAIFGSGSIRVDHVVHRGVTPCFDALAGLGYSTPADIVREHTFIPLLRPFVNSATYAHAVDAMLLGGVTRLSGLSRHRILHDRLRYCQACTADEIRQHGFAYAHRAHQVIGVSLCHCHRCDLVTVAPSTATDAFADHGILTSASAQSDLAKLEEPTRKVRSRTFENRYAALVATVISGHLEHGSSEAHQATLRERLSQQPLGRRAPATTLGSLIREAVPSGLLEATGLSLDRSASSAWPALILEGPTLSNNLIANLIVMSVLFESAADYSEGLRENSASPTVRQDRLRARSASHVDLDHGCENLKRGKTNCNQHSRPISFGLTAIELPLGLIKDFLRDITLPEVALKHQTDVDKIMAVLRSFPRLARRRPAAIHSRRRASYRRAVMLAIRRVPTITQTDYGQEQPREYRWLIRYDKAWLDSALPPQRSREVATGRFLGRRDIDIARHAYTLLGKLTENGREFERRTWEKLLDYFPESTRVKLNDGSLPMAAATLRSLLESESAHIDRCLSSLSEQLATSQLPRARQLACDLISTYAGHKSITNQVVSLLVVSRMPLKGDLKSPSSSMPSGTLRRRASAT